MTKLQIAMDIITWSMTGINIWICRRWSREKRERRKLMLKYRDAEVRALLTRLDEISRGVP